jgi:asparagine synthase (glutamine-hydrolysing)
MCGVTGVAFFNDNHNFNLNYLKNMNNSLYHRGPDSEGFWVSSNQRIFLGHKRLSIIDLSKNGDQPMISSCGRYVITFNGEIYNFRDLLKELKANFNINLQNKTDTIVLLELISKFGLEKALKKVEGMFAFGLWDKKEEKLFLVRDRFGEKPLFYYKGENFVIFGSEMSVFRLFPRLNLEICKEASFYYSMLGYVPAPMSIYKNIYKVMPAEIVFLSDNMESKRIYYEVDLNKDIKKLPLDEHKIQIRNTLENSVKKMMVADVEAGCFLSGGVDSSLVALLMQRNSSRKIKTFNVGFYESEYDESNFARLMAKKIGTEHYQIKLKVDDMLNHIENMVKIIDEPFSDSSIIPTYLISKLASSKVKVALSGDGGDEIFMGYNRYLFARKISNLKKKIPMILRQLISNFLQSVPSIYYDKLSKPFQKMLGMQGFSHKINKLSNILCYNTNSDFYMKLNLFDNKVLLDNFPKKDKIFSEYQNIDLVNSVQRNDLDFYLPNDILVKVDRASMVNSLEVRSPFLNHNVVDNAFILPNEIKLEKKTTKYILKELLSDYMPKSFAFRPKMGFAIPIEKWIENKKFKNNLENIFFESDWNKFGWENKNISNKWVEYKKYKSLTPQCIWMYAMAGLWLNNRN